ncbi:ATP-binding cassette domain-containing protein [Nocardiopsis composta]|uniref:Urea transport system ATP-binding protein n=1 Tax=Nocardiopsis composta TaxID=157465 RepID=A0A7W8VF28_9ACTN|nr:ATP-binding cassette domain-containing protein [Nocardiopsis composta]MBB5434141.1 urea transport system ATP-binding protein [Nocardiopsis composta]
MLEVEGVGAGYGRARVLFDVSVRAEAGAVTCVLGRNGVGKTTLLDTVAGLLPAVSGRIALDGRDVTRLRPHLRVRAGLGYAPQGHGTFAPLTVAENIAVAREAAGRAGPEAVQDALELFPRLRPLLDRRAGLLSGGQAQQLAIARALVTAPKLLVLDEPTEGIQPSIVAEIEAAIRAVAARGTAVLLVEQYMDVALRLADHAVVLDAGRVVHSGPRASLDDADARRLIAI